jgi:hypothetical protein
MDKTVIGFLADVLYIKEVICYEEFEAIQDCKTPMDLDAVFEKMMRGEFNVYRRGEARPKE